MGKNPILQLYIGNPLPQALSPVKVANVNEPPKGLALTTLKTKGTLLLWCMNFFEWCMNFFEMRSYYGKSILSSKEKFITSICLFIR